MRHYPPKRAIAAWLLIFLTIAPNLRAQLLYEDDFTKTTAFGTSAYSNYQNGIYHILAKKGEMTYDNGHDLADFAGEIKTEFIDGNDNQAYGILFRAKDYNNCYFFGISGNGYFELGYYKKGKWFNIEKWKKTPLVNLSGVNFLRVSCKGAQIQLLINGQLAGTYVDRNFQNGYFGVTSFDDVHAHFDDLKIYKSGTALNPKYDFGPEQPNTECDYAQDPDAVFLDNFLNRSRNWGESQDAHYERGYYNMADDSTGHYTWLSNGQTNFILESNFIVNSWQKHGRAGILFRMRDHENYYGFFITEDSSYFLQKSVRDSKTDLIPHTPVKFDKSKAQALRVMCRGNKFTLFLNGYELATAEDPADEFSDENRFGFYVSKKMNVSFLSVKILPVPVSIKLAVMSLATSWYFWASVLIVGGLVFGVYHSRKAKRQTVQQQREKEILDMIKSKEGVLSLGDVMFKYKISKRKAGLMVENIAREYGGSPQLNPDGGVVYEFPDFMPSQDKLRREIIGFAAMRSGRLTVTDTANYLKKDLTETELLLDEMVDGKRVKKDIENEITYYDFVEILSERKRKK